MILREGTELPGLRRDARDLSRDRQPVPQPLPENAFCSSLELDLEMEDRTVSDKDDFGSVSLQDLCALSYWATEVVKQEHTRILELVCQKIGQAILSRGYLFVRHVECFDIKDGVGSDGISDRQDIPAKNLGWYMKNSFLSCDVFASVCTVRFNLPFGEFCLCWPVSIAGRTAEFSTGSSRQLFRHRQCHFF